MRDPIRTSWGWTLLGVLGASDWHPLFDKVGWGACSPAQLGFCLETPRLGRCDHLRPSQARARVLGEQIWSVPRERLQLCNGRSQVVDLAASAVPTADSSYPCCQDLVGRAHTCRPLRTRTDLGLGVQPGRALVSPPYSPPPPFDLFEFRLLP
jgi:hypothetical protein